MRMHFTTGLGRNLAMWEIGDHAKAAEDSGFEASTFVDQQNLCRDVYAMMCMAAINTTRLHVGHGVTNPLTYHPSVIANATASVDELSGGRAFVGLGAGGNAPLTMGLRPSPLRDLRDTVDFIRRYMSGEEVGYRGGKMHSEWIRRPVPIYLAASGPKSLQLAGEIADGVIVVGVHPELLKWRLEQIEKGALRAGRDPSKIDVWARTLCYVAESKDAARRETASFTASAARDTYLSVFSRNSPEGAELAERLERVEPGIVDEFKVVHDNFDHYEHEKTDAPHAKLVTQRVIDMTMLTGTPDDIGEAIQKIGEVGVRTVSCVMYTIIDKKGMMREIGDKIMPHFRN